MSEVIVQADIEAIVITHLNSVLSVPVSQLIPPVRPPSFVTVTRTGGTEQTLVSSSPIVTIDAWAPSTAAASQLARTALAHVHAMAPGVHSGVAVYRADDVSGVAFSPDPDSETPRYRCVVSLHIRSAVA